MGVARNLLWGTKEKVWGWKSHAGSRGRAPVGVWRRNPQKAETKAHFQLRRAPVSPIGYATLLTISQTCCRSSGPKASMLLSAEHCCARTRLCRNVRWISMRSSSRANSRSTRSWLTFNSRFIPWLKICVKQQYYSDFSNGQDDWQWTGSA